MVVGSLDNAAPNEPQSEHQHEPSPTRDDDPAGRLDPPTPTTTTAPVPTTPAVAVAEPPTITPTDQLPQELLDAARGKAGPPERAAYTFGRAQLKGALLVALYEQGTVSSAARVVGLSHSTVRNWRDADPAFDAALVDVDEACIQRVEAALYRDALAGDTVAKIFYLKGRRPKVWHDKARLEVSGPGGGPVPVQVAPEEAAELRETAKALREAKGDPHASE